MLEVKWWTLPRIVKHLELDETQIESLDSLYINYYTDAIKMKSEVQLKQFELKNLLDKEELNERKIEKTFDDFQKSRSELDKLTIMTRVKMLNILDYSQRQKLVLMLRRLNQQGDKRSNKNVQKKNETS